MVGNKKEPIWKSNQKVKNKNTTQNTYMKNQHKRILVLAALMAGSSLQAQVTNIITNPVVYLSGSIAFGPLDHLALGAYAATNGYSLVASAGSADPLKAKALLYKKWTTNRVSASRVTVYEDTINTHVTGSEIAIASAAGTATIPYLPNNSVGLNQPDSAVSYTLTNKPSVLTSPAWQESSRYRKGKYNGVAYKALSEIKPAGKPGIAVQILGWSASSNFPTNGLVITDQTARKLLRDGHAPLSYFTGNTNDATNGVWLVGRDIDAGVRLITLAEAGHGITTDVKQYRVNASNGVVTSLALESPWTNGAGVPSALGNGGYPSTSSQLAAVTNRVSANLQVDGAASPYTGTNYLIQYNGYAQSINPNVKTLAYNGVLPGYNAVSSGAYSLWAYEHIYLAPKVSATASNIAQFGADYISTLSSSAIRTAAGEGYLNIDDLLIKRAVDAGVITLK
jgi:hypothetical protein